CAKIGLVAGDFVDCFCQQAILDLSDGQIAKVVDEIAPRIVQPTDPGNKGYDAAYLEPVGVDPPAADQQSRDDLQMTAEVHQEVHRKFEAKYSHIESKGPVNPLFVSPEVIIGLVNHANPQLT